MRRVHPPKYTQHKHRVPSSPLNSLVNTITPDIRDHEHTTPDKPCDDISLRKSGDVGSNLHDGSDKVTTQDHTITKGIIVKRLD